MKKPSRLALAFLASTALAPLSVAAAPADFIIAGGTVYTGADTGPTTADVVIAGDKIVYVGPDAAKKFEAKTTFDAKGKIVTPGFIDGHTHPDSWIDSPEAKRREAEDFLTQGATTLLMGIEGSGPYNLRDAAAKWGKDGIGVNIVPFVGYGTVRAGILHDDDRVPTGAELDEMKKLVARGMCQGANGLSISLFNAPQSFAHTEEVIELAKIAARYGGFFHTHQRDEASYSIGLMGSTAESIRIAREAGIQVHITHIKAIGPDVAGKAPEVIAAINAARSQGLNITADEYPWAAASTGINVMLMPRWAEDGGRAAMLKRFDDPVLLEKIRTEMRDNLRRRGGADTLLLITSNQEWTGKTLAEMAKTWKLEPVDAAIRIMKTSARGGSLASFSITEPDIEAFMKQPWITTSSDGGAEHPRTVSTYPRKYQTYAIERKVITVQEFVRSSTGRAADNYHLDRRGYLKDGYFADVVVFDPQTFKQKADYVHPHILSEGIDELFVNGKLAVKDAKDTGVLAGAVLLHKPTPGTCS